MRRTTNWAEVVRKTLAKLGGDRVAIPGAKLRAEAEKAAGDDLGAHLHSIGKTFSQFLTEEVPDAAQYKRRGTDMAVGFAGAVVPIARTAPNAEDQEAPLRADVYAALTQVGPRPYSYIPTQDRFTDEPSDHPEAIELPSVTLDELVSERRAFAESVQDPQQHSRLITAIERSANPLGDFRRAVSELGLGRSWYSFKLHTLRGKLERWAVENHLEVRPSWFEQRAEPIDAPQEVLAHLAKHMTDDEVRGLLVPFRAVEALYRAVSRRRRF